MNDWIDIKNKILFSYLGADWISIQIYEFDIVEIHRYLDKRFELVKKEDSIFSFNNSEIETFFYLSSDQIFDFNPNDINSEKQWTNFLDLFIAMSKELSLKIYFKPEDSTSDDKNILIEIIGDNIKYDFQVYKNYLD